MVTKPEIRLVMFRTDSLGSSPALSRCPSAAPKVLRAELKGYRIQSSPVKPRLALLAGRTAGWTTGRAVLRDARGMNDQAQSSPVSLCSRDERLDERLDQRSRQVKLDERSRFARGTNGLRHQDQVPSAPFGCLRRGTNGAPCSVPF